MPCHRLQAQDDDDDPESGSLNCEGGILCPYFLRNPHLVPANSPCRKGVPNVTALPKHFQQIHNLPLCYEVSGTTEFDKFKDLWRFIFPDHQGIIPNPYACDEDTLRRLQNSRLLEIHEKWIKVHFCSPSEGLDTMDRIFEGFRNSIGAFCLPLPDPAMSISHRSTLDCTSTGKEVSALGFLQPEMSTASSETVESSVDGAVTPFHDRNQVCPGIKPTDSMESILMPMKRDIVYRLMKTVRQVVTEHCDAEADAESIDDSDDSYSLVSEFDEIEQCHAEGFQGNRADMDNQPSQSVNNAVDHEQEVSHSTVNPNARQGKRGADDPGSNDGDERGRGKRQRQKSPGENGSSESVKKFSCPWFKHNPQKQRKNSSCRLSGFRNVSRVKEHIYRAHPPIKKCPICFQIFDMEVDLVTHLRARQCNACTEEPDTESITIDQERELRKKDRRAQSEEERWRKVYRIVFGLENNAETPSPYYDAEDGDLLMRFNEYCLKQLPRLFRTKLECEVEKQVRDKIIGILRECQESLFASFQQSDRASQDFEIDSEISGEQNHDSVDALTVDEFSGWLNFFNMD